MQVGDIANLIHTVAGGSLNGHATDDGRSSRLDCKTKLHLLRAGIGRLLHRNLRLVVPVFAKYILNQGDSPVHLAAGIKLAQPQTSGIRQLSVTGSSRRASDRYYTDEIVGRGPVDQIDLVASATFRFYREIGETPGGI